MLRNCDSQLWSIPCCGTLLKLSNFTHKKSMVVLNWCRSLLRLQLLITYGCLSQIFHVFCFLQEQSFNEYFSAEHSRLLSLWRAVVSFRRQFSEMKSATERDLSHVRADLSRVHRSMHSACLNLNANQRSAEAKSSVSQEKVSCLPLQLGSLRRCMYLYLLWFACVTGERQQVWWTREHRQGQDKGDSGSSV